MPTPPPSSTVPMSTRPPARALMGSSSMAKLGLLVSIAGTLTVGVFSQGSALLSDKDWAWNSMRHARAPRNVPDAGRFVAVALALWPIDRLRGGGVSDPSDESAESSFVVHPESDPVDEPMPSETTKMPCDVRSRRSFSFSCLRREMVLSRSLTSASSLSMYAWTRYSCQYNRVHTGKGCYGCQCTHFFALTMKLGTHPVSNESPLLF